MKKHLLFLLIMVISQACTVSTTNQHTSQAISVLIDDTDSMKTWVTDPDPVLRLYNCKANPDDACVFRLRTISDMQLGTIYSCRLPAASELEKENVFDDVQFRERCIDMFYTAVRSRFKEFYASVDTTRSLQQSMCFETICEELHLMMQGNYKRRIMLVNSNLFQNSALFGCYDEANCQLLLNNPDSVVHRFESAKLLPADLTSVVIVFVFQPNNSAEDNLYDCLVHKVYKKLLERRGARISVQAHATSFDV